MSESEKYDLYDEYQPLRNPELKNFRQKLKQNQYLKHQKEFMLKNRYLIDKVEKLEQLMTSLLEKQYQSSQEIENKLEQRILQLQQQIQVSPFSFQHNQSDSMEIGNEASNQNKQQALIQNNQNKSIQEEQNVTYAIINTNENTAIKQVKFKERINKIFLKNYLGYIQYKAENVQKKILQFKSKYLKKQLGSLHARWELIRILEDGTLMKCYTAYLSLVGILDKLMETS